MSIIGQIIAWYFGLLGCLSLLVFASAFLYMLEGLRRRGRYIALAVGALSFAAALSRPGVWLLSLTCGLVVTLQAICYSYFALCTLGRRRRERVWADPLPRVTLIVPAKDEGAVIEETLRSLDDLDYPNELLELVLIDDGSSDDTCARAAALAPEMRHTLRTIRHELPGGKARRLNELFPELESEFVIVLDADHRVDTGLVRRMLLGFTEGADVGCVQVASLVRNGHTNLVAKLLELEYLFRCKGIYPGKRLGVFCGSGGMFRRSLLLELGGFDCSMLTEDVELSYRLYERGLRVAYDDGTSSHELAVTDFKNFFNQRYRWMRGLWQAMLFHLGSGKGGALPLSTRTYLIQFTLDGFGALCMCVLEAYFFLGQLGLIQFHASVPIYLIAVGFAFAFSVGMLRGHKAKNLAFLPLVSFYMVAHTIPMTWALIDSYVLGKPLIWVKTERLAAREPDIGLSGGRA